jgi:hypothetical protein
VPSVTLSGYFERDIPIKEVLLSVAGRFKSKSAGIIADYRTRHSLESIIFDHQTTTSRAKSAMDAERARIEAARRRNLEYINRHRTACTQLLPLYVRRLTASLRDRLDEQRAAREADALLASMAGEFAAATGDGEAAAGAKPKRSGGASVYVTGLATYMACRQLGTDRIAGRHGEQECWC